jgi:preflagellin peptidase FlaK
VGVSVGIVAPLGYIFYRIGGFGGADAKAVLVLALLFPLYPVYFLPNAALPLNDATLGVFSLTILSNTVIAGALYPVALSLGNLVSGRVGLPMIIGRPVTVSSLATAYGSLLETPDGYTRSGLDIDALRMYLRWRGLSLDELRADPGRFRDPASVGETYEPTDGAVGLGGDGGRDSGESTEAATHGDDVSGVEPDGGTAGDDITASDQSDGPATDGSDDADGVDDSDGSDAVDDPWAAEAFLDDIEGTAYGTTPEKLRGGLEVVAERDEVWISPGIPFLVPMFVGTLVAFTYGDIVFGALGALGVF